MSTITPDSAPGGSAAAASMLTPAEAAAAFVARYRWIILIGLITAAVMEVLDTTIINVALPQMAGNLGATEEEIGWVATGYILSNVIFLPMTAFFTERFGRQRYLTFSIFLFIAASFFCGTSNSLTELVFWRIVQGAGGAALLSTAQATLRQIFPLEQQGIVQAVFLLGIIVAPTVGPTLGGWITDNFSWRWVFLLNVPVGMLLSLLAARVIADPPEQVAARKARLAGGLRVDYIGFALLVIGMCALQVVLDKGQE
ncbi:MAG TPA: MFS transporter, partial [Gemmatimonadaceae bacterium]|nr:MFS transporter [Gemmatimonadaceae bacterium]